MFPNHLAAVSLATVGLEQRTPSGPSAADGRLLFPWEPLPHIPQQIGLLVIRWTGRFAWSTGFIGRPHQGAAEKRQHEQNSPVVGGRNQ